MGADVRQQSSKAVGLGPESCNMLLLRYYVKLRLLAVLRPRVDATSLFVAECCAWLNRRRLYLVERVQFRGRSLM